MALNVAQYEEILTAIHAVPPLVDELEARHLEFASDVLKWLKQVEDILTNNRLPAASRIASCRAELIEASRGVRQDGLVIVGRQSIRKIREATAAQMLRIATEILHEVISDRQTVFQEAERITRQMLAAAYTKGLITAEEDSPHQAYLDQLRSKLAADPELAGIYTHVVGLVGSTDIVVLLDRTIASVV